MHINPDDFLATLDGRIVTPERNRDAWAQCFAALDAAFTIGPRPSVVYVMVGPQGAGKSTWATARLREEPTALVFDAILVTQEERAPVLRRCRAHGVPAVAVWLRTPVALCLARNAGRPADEVVAEHAVRNVSAALEPPTVAEGFSGVIEVD